MPTACIAWGCSVLAGCKRPIKTIEYRRWRSSILHSQFSETTPCAHRGELLMAHRSVNFWAGVALVILILFQGSYPQEVFSAEKFFCILGGTGTQHAIPVLAATFGL